MEADFDGHAKFFMYHHIGFYACFCVTKRRFRSAQDGTWAMRVSLEHHRDPL